MDSCGNELNPFTILHGHSDRNAFKHGRYTAEAIARRREIIGLMRAARALASCGSQEHFALLPRQKLQADKASCEEHASAKDRADPHARESALDYRKAAAAGRIVSDHGAAAIQDVLDSICVNCPECPLEGLDE